MLAWRDYFQWTGRFFASAALYIAMAIGRSVSMLPFDLLNAVIFLVLIRNILALANRAAWGGTVPARGALAGANDVLFVALALWWLPRTIGEVALWKTGAIGYLWPVTGELWVLRMMLAGSGENRRWPVALAPLAFAFIIADFLEPLSFGVSALLLGWCALCHWQRRPAPIWLTCCHLAGTAFLLVSPGNFIRAATLSPSPPLDRVGGVVSNLGSLFDPCWIVAVALVALCCARTGPTAAATPATGRWWLLLRGGYGWIFLLLALFYMAVLLGVPRGALAARVSLPASVFLVCYLTAVFLRRPLTTWRNRLTGLALLGLAGIHTAIVVPDLLRLAEIDRTWANDPQLRFGPDTNAILPLVRWNNRTFYARKHVFFEGLTPDPGYFANSCYAAAMRVRTVVAR